MGVVYFGTVPPTRANICN